MTCDCVTLPPRPPRYINLFEPFHFTTGDQQVGVPIGASHISLPLQEIQSREWEKKKEQTNNMLGLNQEQKESYVTLCMCRLTLVWILAKLLQATRMPTLSWPVFLTGTELTHADSSLCCPVSTGHSRHPSPTASSSSFGQLSARRSLPTSGHPRSRV